MSNRKVRVKINGRIVNAFVKDRFVLRPDSFGGIRQVITKASFNGHSPRKLAKALGLTEHEIVVLDSAYNKVVS